MSETLSRVGLWHPNYATEQECYNLTVKDVFYYFWHGSYRTMGRDKEIWFGYDFFWYDGQHVSITLFGIFFYTHY